MQRPGRRLIGASPLEAALDRVGDRWSLLLVEALLDGPRRFNELGERVPASPRTSSPTGSAGSSARGSCGAARTRSARRGWSTPSRPTAASSPARSACSPTGAGARRRRRRAAAPRPVRHAARGPLVLPDVWAGRRGTRGDHARRGLALAAQTSTTALGVNAPGEGRVPPLPIGKPTITETAPPLLVGRVRAWTRASAKPACSGRGYSRNCPTSPDPMLPLADALEQPIDRAMYIPCPAATGWLLFSTRKPDVS